VTGQTIDAGKIGQRVTIRRRLPEGGYSDVVGVLEHADESTVAVRDKRGQLVTIGRAEIAAARVVTSKPPLRNPQNPAPG
jgi:ribosome maturation factor RimP